MLGISLHISPDSSLNRTRVKGKIIVCRHMDSTESRLTKSLVVKKAGGVGMILIDESEDHVAIPFVIPASTVGKEMGDTILSYINSTRRARSIIFPARTILGSQAAPRVAAFSSRGPNSLTPEILKPDVAAPGLNILAAWSPAKNKMNFNILSGTSMSCPHVTGLAALVKAVYPSWSPTAIKSTIMTTATSSPPPPIAPNAHPPQPPATRRPQRAHPSFTALHSKIISPYHLYLNPKLVVQHYEIWRLVTNFLYFRKMGGTVQYLLCPVGGAHGSSWCGSDHQQMGPAICIGSGRSSWFCKGKLDCNSFG